MTAPLPDLSLNAARQRAEHHRSAGRWGEALAAYDDVLKIRQEDITALVDRCHALQRLGRHEDLLATLWALVGIGHQTVSLWLDASAALFKLDRLSESRAALQNALRLDPQCGRAWGALGEILSRRGKGTAAEVCFRRNVALAPEDPLIRLRLAQWLMRDGRYQEAILYYQETLKLAPATLDATTGMAQVYVSQGRLDEAEPLLRRVLERDPQHLDASLGIARLKLLKGDFSAGWPAYEVRRRRNDFKVPKLAGPEWDGSPLSGKTLVVYPEQGFGDVIQFLRYTRILYEEGARVIMLVPKELEALSQCLTMYAEVSSSLRDLPAYDFHIPLLSLAMHLPAEKAIPAQIPYLTVKPNPRQKLPIPLGTKLKVGLVWAGRPTHANNHHRSMTLEALMPLAAIPGVTLYALQAGPRAKDIHKEAHPLLVGDLSPHLKDFADTARVIQQLDVVVAVDTSVAHLAGALGKPVWVLVPFAPDWRWMLGTEGTIWYPTMRLFRQTTPRRWDDVVERVTGELARLAADRQEHGFDVDCIADSVFAKEDGTPRYRMTAPRATLTDAGVGYLFRYERGGTGYEYATRSFLDAHLEPGDLFIDVGAHWGIMSLHAASRWPDVKVLACEPTPRNLPHLKQWIDSNDLADRIEIVPAAIADRAGRGAMLPESTMGHSLEKNADGPIAVTTIDDLLRDRPELAGRRVIVKIDVEGSEADVIAGMATLLASGKVAAIIWERGRTYNSASVTALRTSLAALGFSAWRFGSEEGAGPLLPFENDGKVENIFELAPNLSPLASYGGARRSRTLQPADANFEAAERAHRLFQDGVKHQSAGDVEKALSAYALAGTLDRRSPDLYNNLGVALHRLKRLPAAEAAYRRALALDQTNTAKLSNLGSVLRERGKMAEAAEIQARAASSAPTNAGILSNAGHAHRDFGQLREAQLYYEKVLEIKPNNPEIALELAKCLLRQGKFSEGFSRYTTCRPAGKTKLPGKPWTGEPLKGETILLCDDGDIEDALQFIRFAPEVGGLGAGRIILRCRSSLLPLLSSAPGIDHAQDNSETPPDCAFHASLSDLPALLKVTLKRLGPTAPYLAANSDYLALSLSDDPRIKIGLQWAAIGMRKECSCPIELLLPIFNNIDYVGFSLQQGPAAGALESCGGGDLIRDIGSAIGDFAEAAAILTELDLLITVDGPLAHLAGALGVPTFVLLPFAAEWRWLDDRPDSPWYPSLRLFRQREPNDWESVAAEVIEATVRCNAERASSRPEGTETG